MDTENKIKQVTIQQSGDHHCIDNIYFGNYVTTGLADGPKNIGFGNVGSIPLPTLNESQSFFLTESTIPEPASMILLALGVLGVIRKRK